ncbi:MAG TPA: hypothetical protein DD632_01785 [Oribacterium sp.]|nr:hypothetical protein [Oribacterium sp.]
MTVSQLLLLQCLTIAAGYDLRERRIPHMLIYTYLCFGLFLPDRIDASLWTCSSSFLRTSLFYLLTYLLSFVMLRILTALTHAGGGDARLMALILSWCGAEKGCQLLLPGLAFALLYLLWIRRAFHGHGGRPSISSPGLPLALPLLLGAIPGLILPPV